MQGNGGSGRLNDVPDSALPLDALAPAEPGPVAAPESEPEPRPEADTPVTFSELYSTTYTDMVRLAYLLTGSVETARDLVQDSYLRMHGAWGRVSEPRAYLRRTVVNACNSHHRRTRRQRQHAAATRVEPVAFEAEEMADAIAALPYRQRAAIVLRFWHDCTEAEIAAALGCRPGTVGSLIHRALAELRKVMP
jgi:RNA polymerase sigma-70 factor (sigma-E family)